MLTPTDMQRDAIAKIVAEPTRAALLASEMGFGKTLVATEVCKALGVSTVLVIGPVNTEKQWRTSMTQQEVPLPWRTLRGAPSEDNYAALCAGEPGVYFVGREQFYLNASVKVINEKTGKPELKVDPDAKWNWRKAKVDVVIVDESHSAQNKFGLMASALRTLKPGFKMMLSGTPAGNKFQGIWNPCRWLWPNVKDESGNPLVDPSMWRWAATWATMEYNPYSDTGKKIGVERVPGAFVATLPCYIRYEAEPVKVIKRRVHIPLSPAQQEMYERMERDALIWLGENPLVAELPIVQKVRMRQIALGEVTFNEAGEVDFADDCNSAKADACALILTKHHPGEQVMFYTDSQRFARVLAKRLPGAVEWSGKVNATKREQIKADFIAGKVRHIVAVIPAVAEGVDGLQQVCHTEVWLNKSFNGVLNQQAAARIARRGQEQPVISYELCSPKTDDENYLNNLAQYAAEMRASLHKEA